MPRTTGSSLFRLPPEILVNILECSPYLERLCLALTCKHMLQVSSLVKIRVPSVAHHRHLPPSTCYYIFDLFRRLAPRDKKHVRLPDRSIGLCCDCLRFRTRRKGFWTPRGKRYVKKLGVMTADDWRHTVKAWTSAYIFQCPECYCDERYVGREKPPDGAS